MIFTPTLPGFLVVLPVASDLSPIEGLNLYEARLNANYDYVSTEPQLLRAFDGVNAPLINPWPLMQAYEKAPTQGPLYTTNDGHLTPFGRQMIANYVAQQLEIIKPWISMRKKK
jgi:hypothetical protein